MHTNYLRQLGLGLATLALAVGCAAETDGQISEKGGDFSPVELDVTPEDDEPSADGDLELAETGTTQQGIEVVKSLTLPKSKYTSGTTKSFEYSTSFLNCGNIRSDVSVRVYYDRLNTSKIHVTRVLTKYWVKGGSTSGLWGGTLWATDGNGRQKQWMPNIYGDHSKFYPYRSSTRDSDGYSYVGSYTHRKTGGITINGRRMVIVKRTNVSSSSCAGSWNYSIGQVNW